jgi:hypothetical protein
MDVRIADQLSEAITCILRQSCLDSGEIAAYQLAQAVQGIQFHCVESEQLGASMARQQKGALDGMACRRGQVGGDEYGDVSENGK